MDAKIAEIKSKMNTAISNMKTVKAAYKHATETCLGDEVFKAMEISLIKTSLDVREGLTNSSGPDLLRFIPVAEEYADAVLKASERALERMQVVVTAATERERAKEGEASNKPGGSNA